MIKNFVPRLYQQTIFATAAEKNTLVVLPTGMGKTNIFLMLAAQRLKQFPNSKVLFIGPTKPLIEQLNENGILIAPVGSLYYGQNMIKITKKEHKLIEEKKVPIGIARQQLVYADPKSLMHMEASTDYVGNLFRAQYEAFAPLASDSAHG